MNHYQWCEKNLSGFFEKVGVHGVAILPLLSAHGDKFYGYEKAFAKAGLEFHEGVAIGLLTYIHPFESEVRQTAAGWVKIEDWVAANKDRFLPYLRQSPGGQSTRTPLEALQYVLEKAEQHPMCSAAITADIMRGDFGSAENEGGDAADWSEIAAICRLSLGLPAPQ